MNKLLSICIPTYNRREFLRSNLLEIIDQANEANLQDYIEICISDNASSDNTSTMIKDLCKDHSNIDIIYSDNKSNVGPERNFIIVMKMATAKYSWLLGSDDMLGKHSLISISKELSNDNFDILLFNRNNYDKSMKTFISQSYFLRPHIESQIFDFKDPIQEKIYLNNAQTLGAVFSYISSIIYRTDIVRENPFDESFFTIAYPHAYYFFKCIKSGGKLKYQREPFINNRLGNDSFGSGYKRKLLDYNGYNFIRNKFYNNDDNEIDFMRILKSEHPFFSLIEMCCEMKKKEWLELTPILILSGWTEIELKHIELISNTPNMYRSKFKQWLKKALRKN